MMKLFSAVLALVTISALSASGTIAAPRASDPFLVPVKAHQSGFGPFREAFGPSDSVRLTNAFGTPSSTQADGSESSCRLVWGDLGIKVRLFAFGDAGDPCNQGTFVLAGLSDQRWHTPSGVRPGSRARKARRASKGACTRRRCGVSGFILGNHFSDCADSKVPSVIAKVKKKRVASLIVFSRGCE